MKKTVYGSIVALLASSVIAAEPAAPADDAVSLKAVKYADLARTVRDLQGKVVVVDFWGEFCVPCKKEFPHLVEMQHKYAADGLAAVSVTIDKADDKPATERALKFLRSVHADFTNLLLDEPPAEWSAKLNAEAVPFVFVFDRDGRVAGKFEGKKADYTEQIGPLVAELLKK